MRARLTAAGLLALVWYYTVTVGWRGVVMLGNDRWAVRGLGLGIVLVSVVGALIAGSEVRFGRATARLARAAGEVDGRDFDTAAAAVEAAPEEWRAWYRLALAYDIGRDSKRGRAAMRKAIALERAAR